MNCSMLRQSVVLTSVLVLGGLAAGCATVVRPLSPAQPISADGSHGLLVGHIRLAWHEPDQSARSKQPLAMKWSLTEEMQGKHVVLADLPTTGLFAVKLPAGSYRLIDISFNDLRGTWHAVLPTTFPVQSGGCTSIGTWELQRESESFADWITGHVFRESDLAHAELQSVLATGDCPSVAHSPDSAVRNKLGFQRKHGGSEF